MRAKLVGLALIAVTGAALVWWFSDADSLARPEQDPELRRIVARMRPASAEAAPTKYPGTASARRAWDWLQANWRGNSYTFKLWLLDIAKGGSPEALQRVAPFWAMLDEASRNGPILIGSDPPGRDWFAGGTDASAMSLSIKALGLRAAALARSGDPESVESAATALRLATACWPQTGLDVQAVCLLRVEAGTAVRELVNLPVRAESLGRIERFLDSRMSEWLPYALWLVARHDVSMFELAWVPGQPAHLAPSEFRESTRKVALGHLAAISQIIRAQPRAPDAALTVLSAAAGVRRPIAADRPLVRRVARTLRHIARADAVYRLAAIAIDLRRYKSTAGDWPDELDQACRHAERRLADPHGGRFRYERRDDVAVVRASRSVASEWGWDDDDDVLRLRALLWELSP